MKVMYDNHHEVFIIEIEHLETRTVVSSNDVVKAREEFIKCMTRLFNDAVNNKLKD